MDILASAKSKKNSDKRSTRPSSSRALFVFEGSYRVVDFGEFCTRHYFLTRKVIINN